MISHKENKKKSQFLSKYDEFTKQKKKRKIVKLAADDFQIMPISCKKWRKPLQHEDIIKQ